MHELGYCEAVLRAVERRAGGRPVSRVRVQVGSLHRILPTAFDQSFQLVAAGGVAEGATTEVVVVAARAGCRDCGSPFDCSDSIPACPACGSLDVEVQGGDELILEFLEFRADDEDHEHSDVTVFHHSHPPGESQEDPAQTPSGASSHPPTEGS